MFDLSPDRPLWFIGAKFSAEIRVSYMEDNKVFLRDSMKLRYVKEISKTWRWSSRYDRWYLEESNRGEGLQYWDEGLQLWKYVETVVISNDPGPKPKD